MLLGAAAGHDGDDHQQRRRGDFALGPNRADAAGAPLLGRGALPLERERGLESVEAALGTREYARLRIGVGSAPSEALREHVLDAFTDEEQAEAEEAVRLAADAVECWIGEGLLAAMNRFNRRVRKEVSES